LLNTSKYPIVWSPFSIEMRLNTVDMTTIVNSPMDIACDTVKIGYAGALAFWLKYCPDFTLHIQSIPFMMNKEAKYSLNIQPIIPNEWLIQCGNNPESIVEPALETFMFILNGKPVYQGEFSGMILTTNGLPFCKLELDPWLNGLTILPIESSLLDYNKSSSFQIAVDPEGGVFLQ